MDMIRNQNNKGKAPGSWYAGNQHGGKFAYS
jgi:hypothetical protein